MLIVVTASVAQSRILPPAAWLQLSDQFKLRFPGVQAELCGLLIVPSLHKNLSANVSIHSLHVSVYSASRQSLWGTLLGDKQLAVA